VRSDFSRFDDTGKGLSRPQPLQAAGFDDTGNCLIPPESRLRDSYKVFGQAFFKKLAGGGAAPHGFCF